MEKSGVRLNLKMGEDEVDLLYKMTPYHNYKKFLLMEQNFKCADCNRNLEREESVLHHDPPKGRKGARYIDFKRLTRNRMLCRDCHNRASGKRILCRLCREIVYQGRRKHLKEKHPKEFGKYSMDELLRIYRDYFDTV